MTTERSLPAPLARAQGWARAQPWLGRFTLMNRLLLAMAFIPTGLVKATGQRFTTLPVDSPVGFFFEAMYQTGPYWHFIGSSQIAASVFLLIPATATLGALLSLPIALSIFLITYGIGFGNTVYVTGGMLLSVLYLICWDADRIWAATNGLVGRRSTRPLLEGATGLERAGWGLGGLVGIMLFMVTRGLLPNSLILELFVAGGVAAIVVVAGWVLGGLRNRAGAHGRGSGVDGIEVRTLGPGDEDALRRVASDVFDGPVRPELAGEFLADPRHHIAAAIEDGVVVGFASGVHYIHPDKPAEMFVNELGVAASHRRRGLGRRVLEALLTRGRELGCREAWVLSDHTNEAAIGLYEAVGGKDAGEGVVMLSIALE